MGKQRQGHARAVAWTQAREDVRRLSGRDVDTGTAQVTDMQCHSENLLHVCIPQGSKKVLWVSSPLNALGEMKDTVHDRRG